MVLAFHVWSDYHRYPNHSSLHLHAEILRRRCNRRSSQIKSIMYIENFRQVNIGSFYLRKCRTYLLFPFYMRLLISYRQKDETRIISRLILYFINYNLRLCDGACWFPKRQLHQVPYQKLQDVLLLNQYLAE